MTTKSQIAEWFDEGKKNNTDFMIVVCDGFDHSDFPVYASAAAFADVYREYSAKDMHRITEVYDLGKDKNEQLEARRAFNFPENWNAVAEVNQ